MTKQEAIERLREWIADGETVYTSLVDVSRSGISRKIKVILLKVGEDGQPYPLFPNYAVSQALGWAQDSRSDAIKVRGCGMDMGFHLVYTLGQVIGRELNHRWL